MTIETDNAKEEVMEIVEKCFRCGLCRELCPVLRVMRTEQFSPRGKAVILDNGGFEKLIYDCCLCKSCERNCPADIPLCEAFIKARQVLVGQKREIEGNKIMIMNLEATGNIFGERE